MNPLSSPACPILGSWVLAALQSWLNAVKLNFRGTLLVTSLTQLLAGSAV